ncbi:MAG: hypothetical protein DRP09_17675 [Candidatus Thorarchaeota archaeon]|nr:MAG: hypothetical protein DRP09_17675 [Candidatus Thorarchaeota archaeon]
MSTKNDAPDAPATVYRQPVVHKDEEGIRLGEDMRSRRRRILGQLYMTKGQTRQTASPGLAGVQQTLG